MSEAMESAVELSVTLHEQMMHWSVLDKRLRKTRPSLTYLSLLLLCPKLLSALT